LRASPTTNLRLPRQDEGETVKALSEEELAGVLVQLPDEHKLFFRFLFETGLRIGEAIEVRYGDADLPEVGVGWLAVTRQYSRGKVCPPKGRKRRRIRLSAGMTYELRKLHKESGAVDEELIFTAERGGRIIPSNLTPKR
jgi:integrase